jgi:hypothetical protein
VPEFLVCNTNSSDEANFEEELPGKSDASVSRETAE